MLKKFLVFIFISFLLAGCTSDKIDISMNNGNVRAIRDYERQPSGQAELSLASLHQTLMRELECVLVFLAIQRLYLHNQGKFDTAIFQLR